MRSVPFGGPKNLSSVSRLLKFLHCNVWKRDDYAKDSGPEGSDLYDPLRP